MTYAEYQAYMKNFFEQYYQKLSQDDSNIKLPLNEKNREMWHDDADPNEEWKKWKLVPAQIAEEEIADFEEEIGVKLPLSLKAFLTTYHHLFENPIGRNSFAKHFEGMRNAWNPILVKCGYLPFTWDKEDCFIRCVRLSDMPEEEKCGIYQIDHEALFDFDEESVTQEEMDENMEFVSENLLTYLDEILHDRDMDSVREAREKELEMEVLAALRDECGIEDYEALEAKLEEDPDSVYDALKPVADKYELSEDDLEELLEDVEYWLPI